MALINIKQVQDMQQIKDTVESTTVINASNEKRIENIKKSINSIKDYIYGTKNE